MIGSICVGVVGRSTGCIIMGPVLSDCGVLLGMTINAQPPFSFEGDGRGIPGAASQHACGRLAVLSPEGSKRTSIFRNRTTTSAYVQNGRGICSLLLTFKAGR
jgi:hypothetical protein